MLVKNLLPNNPDGAREKVDGLRETTVFPDALKILQEQTPKPEDKCSVCGEVMSFHFSITDLRYVVSARCGTCVEREEVKKRDQDIQRVKNDFNDNIKTHLLNRGMPDRFLDARIEQLPAAYQPITKEIKGLFLAGDRGTGKTHIACAIMRDSTLQVRPREKQYGGFYIYQADLPLFVSVSDLFLEVGDTFKDKETSVKNIVDKYSAVSTLVLDDIGTEGDNAWAFQILFAIVDRRYNKMRKTIFTSNLSLQDLSNKLGDRIASRIAEMCVVKVIKGCDRRLSIKGNIGKIE